MAELYDFDGWEPIKPKCTEIMDDSKVQISNEDSSTLINQPSKFYNSNINHQILGIKEKSCKDNIDISLHDFNRRNQFLSLYIDDMKELSSDEIKIDRYNEGHQNFQYNYLDDDKNFPNSKKFCHKSARKNSRKSYNVSLSNSLEFGNKIDNFEMEESNKPHFHNNDKMNLSEIIKSDYNKIQILKSILNNDSSLNKIVKFQFKGDEVIIKGVRKEEILNVKLKIYDYLSKITCNKAIDLESNFIKLLKHKYSCIWINKKFHENNKLIYVSKDCYFYSYQCTSHDIKTVIKNIVVSKLISFTSKPDVNSAQWQQIEMMDSRKVVAVEVNDSNISICGCSEEVKNKEHEILKFLEDYTIITEKISMYKGQLDLLRNNINDVKSSIQDVYNGKVTISMVGALQVSGHLEGVKIAKLKINEFVRKIVNEKFSKNKAGLTIAAFTEKEGEMSIKKSGLESQYNVIIEVKLKTDVANSASKHSSNNPVKVASTSSINDVIEIKKGDITQFTQADALINPICKKNLEHAGVICKQFMKSGGKQLFDEVAANIPCKFGSKPYVTKTYGSLNTTSVIYHVCLRQYKNDESYKLLTKMIEKCIKQAINDNLKSIAFPTVGCGNLKYRSNDVIDCFKNAVKDTNCNIKIYIVAFENDLHDLFLQNFSKSTVGSKLWKNISNFKNYLPFQSKPPESLEFRINALSTESLQTAKKKLECILDDNYQEIIINDDTIGQLNESQITKITMLGGKNVNINIDNKKNKIILSGESNKIVLIQQDIFTMLNDSKDNKVEVDLQFIKKKGISEFFNYIIEMARPQYPKYWTNKKEREVIELKTNDPLYSEVLNFVMNSWDSKKVGQGQDAIGFTHKNIKVTKISVVQDNLLYFAYFSDLKKICMGAGSKVLPRVQDLQGENPILTETLCGKLMKSSLISELNECFLFHGTKSDNLNNVMTKGIDVRHASNGMYGKGIYFSESSVKSDQYTDSKTHRTQNGTPLYLIIGRVCLGKIFICKDPYDYKTAPCTTCYKDKCNHNGNFDSILGTEKGNKIRLLFREFVVYSQTQAYPEFIVEYVRN